MLRFLPQPPADHPASTLSISDIPHRSVDGHGPVLHIDLQAVITILLPASAALLTLTADLLARLPYPKPLKRAAYTLSTPFRSFFTLADVDEPTPCPLAHPPWKARLLVLGSVLESIAWLAALAYRQALEDWQGSVRTGVAFLAWTYAFVRVLSKPPVTPPYLLICFYVTCAVAALYDFTTTLFPGSPDHWRYGSLALDLTHICLTSLLIWVAGTYPLLSVWPGPNVAKPSDPASSKYTMPEDNADLWRWSTFSFVEPLFEISDSRTINDTDVWTLSPLFKHKVLFRKYLHYVNEHPSHSLLRYLFVSNSLDLILDLATETWVALVGFAPTYSVQRILTALSDPSPNAKPTAYLFALVMFLANLSFAWKDVNKTWFTRRCYERTRGQLFCALHYKALKRRDLTAQNNEKKNDSTDESKADLGKVVNLMQGDAYNVAQRFWKFAGIFLAPVRLAIALVYLYRVLGWSAFAAVGVSLLACILNYPLARYSIYLARLSWKASDQRMNTVNEFLQNIRFLKFYGWEYRWGARVKDAREHELKLRIRAWFLDGAMNFMWTIMPTATAIVTFVCYTTVAHQPLTPATAFTALSLFSYLQGPMIMVPDQIFAILHAYISMQRIESFLNEPEVPDWASSLKRDPRPTSSNEAEIGFDHASFEWDVAPEDQPSRFALGPLNVRFPPGKLSLVSGATGSGKTALLTAMLGEMHCTSGSVVLNKAGHEVAYCAQNSWLEHATIRDNIIFGAGYGYDEARYEAVVDACALAMDFEMFSAGDMTEIGEKGITLSGGQRARVALARALYSPAKVILLDDPLAAVDLHTATHIVKTALSGDLARDRTIILVTHHITVCLPHAAYLLELSSGEVIRSGSIADLRERGELEKFVEAEDSTEESGTIASSPTETEVENEGDLMNGKKPADGKSGDVTKDPGKLVEDEHRAEGRVSWHTYWTYIRSAGVVTWFAIFALMLVIRFLSVGVRFFLAKWGEAYEHDKPVAQRQGIFDSLPPPEEDVKPWMLIYLAISLSGALFTLIFIVVGYIASLKAARSLFIRMLERLSRAPARFFDTTPIGRILNRFTSDVSTLDHSLHSSARSAISGMLNFIISFAVIVIVVPSFAPFAIIIAWLYIRLAPSYVRASRDLRRLESVSLSPAFAGFDELLRGLPHVRAFGVEERYQDRFYERVDKFQSFDHAYWLIASWLNWRYDCLGSVVVFLTTIFALMSGVSSGYAGLVIVQAGDFAGASRQLVRVMAQVELDFNSVERIKEYLEVAQEAPAVINEKRPPAAWPTSNGELVVQDLTVKYAPHLPDVLKSLSFTVRPMEKIGIVGRTGSGKSTLAMSLLRIVEPRAGQIFIDGIDINTIGLEDLRSRITIISQDVSLFSGTLRSNLDPFDEHTDEECWDVLERCHLTTILKSSLQRSHNSPHEITLDMPITQTGSLSAGERQLVAMARAILRRSNVVIMDEATSQIDSDLDDQIQRTVREEFAGSIVITIAHRLKTVLDYDRILVLGGGEIVEFDSPAALLQTPGSAFRELCRASTDRRVFMAASERGEH